MTDWRRLAAPGERQRRRARRRERATIGRTMQHRETSHRRIRLVAVDTKSRQRRSALSETICDRPTVTLIGDAGRGHRAARRAERGIITPARTERHECPRLDVVAHGAASRSRARDSADRSGSRRASAPPARASRTRCGELLSRLERQRPHLLVRQVVVERESRPCAAASSACVALALEVARVLELELRASPPRRREVAADADGARTDRAATRPAASRPRRSHRVRERRAARAARAAAPPAPGGSLVASASASRLVFRREPRVDDGAARARRSTPSVERDRREPAERVVLAHREAKLRARREQPIRLVDAARHEIVDQHADVRRLATEDHGRRGRARARRRSAGDDALPRRFLVAGRAVDLSGEEQPAQRLAPAASRRAASADSSRTRSRSPRASSAPARARNGVQHLELHRRRQRRRQAVDVQLVRVVSLGLEEELMPLRRGKLDDLVFDRRAVARTARRDRAAVHRRLADVLAR